MATKLIHCKTYSIFNSKKLSAQVENTSYTVGVGGSKNTGTPEINYQDIVFIKDTRQIWTHGCLYGVPYNNPNISYSVDNLTITDYIESPNGEFQIKSDGYAQFKQLQTEYIASDLFDGPATALTSKSIGSTTNPVYFNSAGVPKACDYSLSKSVPANAVFTDTKVTSAANHYTPTENTDAAISASGGSATNITGTSGKLNVVTGLKRDAKGHIVGVTSANIYSTDNNTDSRYTQFIDALNNSNVCPIIPTEAFFSAGTWEDWPEDAEAFLNFCNEDAKTLYYNGEEWVEGGMAATGLHIPYANTTTSGLMSAADKTKLDGIAAGSNKYTLPNATSSTLGGVKIGSNISVSSGTISLTKSNVTSALGYTPPTTNTTYSVATASTDGLMSKTVAEALSSYSSYTYLYDVEGNVTQGSDKVNVHWTQFCDYVDYSKNNFTENIKSHQVDFDIPAATTAKAGVMSAIDKSKVDGTNIGFGTCSTAPFDAAKIVELTSGVYWKARPGSVVYVWSSYSNIANNPTLNVNNTGAFPIYYNGSQITTSNKSYATYANRLMKFVFTGKYYMFAGWGVDTNTTYSVATSSANGLMSAADKAKLDSIESGADSIVISKTSAGGKTTASFTVNGGTATTFDIYGITDTYNPTSASSTYSLSQLGAKNLYNAVLSKAGGDMNSDARISASGGSLYLGNANNSGWLYLQDCASQKNDTTNTYWYIKNDGNSLFQTADIKTTLTLNNSAGNYNGIIFKFGDAVGTHIYQTYDSNNDYYSLTIDGNIFIGGSGKGNLNVNGVLKAQGGNFEVLSDGAYWRSDKRFKDNISNARNLNIDSLIREFDWKDTGNHSWGFIAQELLEVLPEAVNYDEQIDRYSVNYDVAHSAAIASLSAKIEQLESRIKELEK